MSDYYELVGKNRIALRYLNKAVALLKHAPHTGEMAKKAIAEKAYIYRRIGRIAFMRWKSVWSLDVLNRSLSRWPQEVEATRRLWGR